MVQSLVVNFIAEITGCGEYICDKGVLGRTTRPLPVCESVNSNCMADRRLE